jgi:GNAT superfamily N-acetyltransferase
MLWRGGEVEPGGAREVRLEEIETLRKAIIDESMPPDGGGQAAVDQLFENDRRYGLAGGDRWFVAPAEGEPMSACRLLRNDDIGQVEEVGTLEPARDRGLGRTVITTAIAASQAAGDQVIFLTADAADWPQLLYARMGFETVGDLTVLRRRP